MRCNIENTLGRIRIDHTILNRLQILAQKFKFAVSLIATFTWKRCTYLNLLKINPDRPNKRRDHQTERNRPEHDCPGPWRQSRPPDQPANCPGAKRQRARHFRGIRREGLPPASDGGQISNQLSRSAGSSEKVTIYWWCKHFISSQPMRIL